MRSRPDPHRVPELPYEAENHTPRIALIAFVVIALLLGGLFWASQPGHRSARHHGG